MFRGSRRSKRRVTKAVGAEPSGAKAVNRVGIFWQDNCKYIWEICEELKGFRESGCHVVFLVRQLNYHVLSLSSSGHVVYRTQVSIARFLVSQKISIFCLFNLNACAFLIEISCAQFALNSLKPSAADHFFLP